MTDLYRRNGSAPAPLPSIAYDAKGQAWTNLAGSTDARVATGFVFFGSYDPAKQHVVQNGSGWVIEAIPQAPEPEPVEPQPRTLGKLEFIRLAQDAGGMTDQMLVEAQGNPAYAAFWIKFQMASSVERGDPITATALGALAMGGYLPNGPAAVLEAWPVS